jgi:hypothetical protein
VTSRALFLRRGEQTTVQFTVTKSDGSAFDLATAQELHLVAAIAGVTRIDMTRTDGQIVNVDPAGGICAVTFDDPTGIPEPVLVYTLIVTDASGIDVPVASGPLLLEPIGLPAIPQCVLYGRACPGDLVRVRLLAGQALTDGSPALTYPQNIYADPQGTWAAMLPQGLRFSVEMGEANQEGSVPRSPVATLVDCGLEDVQR